jgi:hypothetical protein
MLQSIFYLFIPNILIADRLVNLIAAEHNILRYLFYIQITIVDNHPMMEVDN